MSHSCARGRNNKKKIYNRQKTYHLPLQPKKYTTSTFEQGVKTVIVPIWFQFRFSSFVFCFRSIPVHWVIRTIGFLSGYTNHEPVQTGSFLYFRPRPIKKTVCDEKYWPTLAELFRTPGWAMFSVRFQRVQLKFVLKCSSITSLITWRNSWKRTWHLRLHEDFRFTKNSKLNSQG